MDNNQNQRKADFNEALSYLVETANINNGTLNVEEIKASLGELIEDDSMYRLVYDYLLEKKITVEGYAAQTAVDNSDDSFGVDESNSNRFHTIDSDISDINISTNSIDTKERGIVDMYLNDINSSKLFSEVEEYEALADYLSDHLNRDTVNLLTEMNLRLVPPLADEFKNKGVAYGDLLQEGNLGLIEGIMTYKSEADLERFHKHIAAMIRGAMNDAVLEQNVSSRIGSHAADRANELDRASVSLSKELDRTPTLEELARYLSLPVDEVEQIMKMSLNALTIDEGAGDN